MSKAITEAVIYKVQTLADGGARVTLDFSEDQSNVIQALILKKLSGDSLISMAFLNAGVIR